MTSQGETPKFQGRYRIDSNRLKGYDYTQAGAYFLTVCTHHRQAMFGKIRAGEMHLSAYGEIVQEEWLRSAEIRAEIELDAFVVMPDHFHCLVMIRPLPAVDGYITPPSPLCEPPTGLPAKSIGALMAGFKSAATLRINQLRKMPGWPVWQRNYHDRIVRDPAAFERIRAYIENNPRQWTIDHDPTRRVD